MHSLMPSPWSRPWHPRGPRVDWTQWHHLTNMLVVAVPAVICGADNFEASAPRLGCSPSRSCLTGSPHTTRRRGSARSGMQPARMEKGFWDGVQNILALTAGQIVVIASGTL